MCLRGAGRAEFDYEQCQLSTVVRWGASRLHQVDVGQAFALSTESVNQSRSSRTYQSRTYLEFPLTPYSPHDPVLHAQRPSL
jgi:hypothetical protein